MATLAAVLSGVGGGVALAENIDVTVKNDRGDSIAGAEVAVTGCGLGAGQCTAGSVTTGGNGHVTVQAANGDSMSAKRVNPGNVDACPSDQSSGIAAGGTVEIQLPSLLTGSGNGITDSERYLLGVINRERTSIGRNKLQMSAVMARTADRWAKWFVDNENSSIANGHRKLCDVKTRLWDGGWPLFVQTGENLASTTNGAPGVFNGNGSTTGWLHHPGHYQVMTDSKYDVAGVGHSGKVWVLDVSEDCPNADPLFELCELIPGEFGDPNADPGVPDNPDNKPPGTFFTKRPGGVTHDRSPTFGFKSNEAGAKFQCKMGTAGKFKTCRSPKTYHGLSYAKHTFKVRAIDRAGNKDPSPASFTFRIKRRRHHHR